MTPGSLRSSARAVTVRTRCAVRDAMRTRIARDRGAESDRSPEPRRTCGHLRLLPEVVAPGPRPGPPAGVSASAVRWAIRFVSIVFCVFAIHVRSLGSKFGPPGTQEELRGISLKHSDAKTFIRRAGLTLGTDLRPGLGRVNVPTLVLTPEDGRLIGPASAAELVNGIPDAEEYGQAVGDFTGRRLALAAAGEVTHDQGAVRAEASEGGGVDEG